MSELLVVDEFGPRRVVHLHEPAVGLRAVVVVDNVAAGPSIGGVRMALDVSAQECFRLARAMTWKNAAAGLSHGGGKAVVFADPRMPIDEKEPLVRAFADLIGDMRDYIPGPDMGTNEVCMAWVHDEIGRAVGLPRVLGGIPLDEIGATGFGLAAAVDVAAEHIALDLAGARVAVQGFGAVGKHAARFLAERGAVLVAAADSRGVVIDPSGIDVAMLSAIKDAGGSVVDASFGEKRARESVFEVDCDILIPAARPDAITVETAGELRTRIVAQGANIPAGLEAEQVLYQRGVLSLPDFIANAGGVICAAAEYHGGTEAGALAAIDEKVRGNVQEVLERSRALATPPRVAAVALAEERVRNAMQLSRWH